MKKLDVRLLRMIKHSKGQFISVTVIIAVALCIYMLFGMISLNIKNAVDTYYSLTNINDIHVQLVKIPQGAVNELKTIDGIKEVQGRVSFDTYQKIVAKLAEAEANLEVSKSNLSLAQKGISGNVRNQYEAQIAGIQAQIEILKKQQSDLTVKAPVDGIVMAKDNAIGNVVQPGMLLMEIGNPKGVFLESDILVGEIGEVRQGAAVLIENEDLGINNIRGTVRKIYPKAFSKMSELGIEQKRVKLEISFDGDIEGLKSGYDMNVKVITAHKENALLINEKAVFQYQGKNHVFANENGIATLKAIEKGLESDERVEVLNGLTEGEKIILSPDEKVEEGIKIE